MIYYCWVLDSLLPLFFCSDAMDQLEQRVNEFFTNAKKNKPEWREEQMEVIKKDYYKALEDADEKVQLANQIYDLVSNFVSTRWQHNIDSEWASGMLPLPQFKLSTLLFMCYNSIIHFDYNFFPSQIDGI
uniref:Inhibitor of growth protein N-terminal histone-binding domain-containing protein n=1 Tax=Sinocyclocheilus grahami TaxID=75366 RepID=A0A672K4P6_SINGR